MSRTLRDFTEAVHGFDAGVDAPADATPAQAFPAFTGRNPRP